MKSKFIVLGGLLMLSGKLFADGFFYENDIIARYDEDPKLISKYENNNYGKLEFYYKGKHLPQKK